MRTMMVVGECNYRYAACTITVLLMTFLLLSLLSSIGLMGFSDYYGNTTTQNECLSGNISHCLSPENRHLIWTAIGGTFIVEVGIVFSLLIAGLCIRYCKRRFSSHQEHLHIPLPFGTIDAEELEMGDYDSDYFSDSSSSSSGKEKKD